MACCVVAALVLAVLHGLTPWRRRKPDVAGFAPPARRSGPGEPERLVPAADLPLPARPLSRRAAALGWVARFVAVGAVVYIAAAAVLVRSGQAHSVASGSQWLARTLALVVAAGIAMALSANIFRRGIDRSSGREIVGYAAIGFALTVIEGLALDMHLLSLFHLMNAGLHDGIHIAAFVALILGFAIALPVSRQPSKVV